MTLTKRLLRSAAVRIPVCALAALYIRLVRHSGRWETVGGATPAAQWDRGEPFIVAFWHGRLLMLPYCWRRGMALNLLISQHADGQLIARVAGHFGLSAIAGSTSRGGASAARAMLRAIGAGDSIGITPDGPRGPRMRCGGGIIDIARASGAPIVPVAYASSRRRVISSWDRFVVALPFGRGVFVWGEAIRVPRNADAAAVEAARRLLEERLNGVTDEADRRVGQSLIEPADEPAGETA